MLDLGTDAGVGSVLSEAQLRYLRDLPGIQHMRNALTHFDNWAIGDRRGPQREGLRMGSAPRDVAGYYWGFGYDPRERVVTLGPFSIEVANAVPAARRLEGTTYAAAREVIGNERRVAQMFDIPGLVPPIHITPCL